MPLSDRSGAVVAWLLPGVRRLAAVRRAGRAAARAPAALRPLWRGLGVGHPAVPVLRRERPPPPEQAREPRGARKPARRPVRTLPRLRQGDRLVHTRARAPDRRGGRGDVAPGPGRA